MAQAPLPSDQTLDPGLAAALAQSQGASGGGGNLLQDILQQTLYGVSGLNQRAMFSTQPLVGIIPQWVRTSAPFLAAVQQRQIDPYIPTQDVSTWRVFTGRSDRRNDIETHIAQRMDDQGAPRALAGDKTDSVNAVANQPFLWSSDQVAEAIKKFQDAGMTNVKDFDSMQQAWTGLVQRAGAMYSLSSGKKKVTPWDVLDLYKSEVSKAGTGAIGGSPSTVTQRTRSVATITHGDGWNALQNTLSHMLGRDPTDAETRDFVGRMNHLAAANPTISTSTTSGIGTAHQNTSTHTKSGFDSNDILENAYHDAQANPDYAEFQSASTYFNAALSALGAIGG